MSDANTALVIGADGLLGSHLVRQLLAAGHQVRAMVLPGSESPTLDGLPIERLPGDLLAADGQLERAVAGCQIVFHVAAITDLWADRTATFRVNVEGTRRVVDACLTQGVGRLVFVGSASTFQFGDKERPGAEDGGFPAAYRGLAYMESKHEATELVLSAVRERGLDAVVVAPTFLLGDLDWRPSSGELIRQFLKRRMRFVSAGGRSFAYAPDVAGAMVQAARRGEKGSCYICGGWNLDYREFFGQVARAEPAAPKRLFVLPDAAVRAVGTAGSLAGRALRRRLPLDRMTADLSLVGAYYDSTRAVTELGMQQTPIHTAIAASIRSLREFGHI